MSRNMTNRPIDPLIHNYTVFQCSSTNLAIDHLSVFATKRTKTANCCTESIISVLEYWNTCGLFISMVLELYLWVLGQFMFCVVKLSPYNSFTRAE